MTSHFCPSRQHTFDGLEEAVQGSRDDAPLLVVPTLDEQRLSDDSMGFFGNVLWIEAGKMGDLKQKLVKRIRNQLISTLFCEET